MTTPVKEPRLQQVLVPVSVVNYVDNSKEKIDAAKLTKPESDFMHALLQQALERNQTSVGPGDEFIYLSFEEISLFLQEHSVPGPSEKSVRRKLQSLSETGFFKSVDIPTTRGGRAPKKYILHDIHHASFETQDQQELREQAQGHRNSRTKSTKAMLNYLRNSAAQLTTFVNKHQPVTETLFTGCLDRSMRFTTADKVPGNRITSKLRIKNTDLLVMATTQTGPSSELAALSDQRVIRAVLTEVAHFIDSEIDRYILDSEQPKQTSLFGDEDEVVIPDLYDDELIESPSESGNVEEDTQEFESKFTQRRVELEKSATSRIHNDFFIDTLNIARRMEYKSPHSSSTRRFINSSLRRLYDTNFRLAIKSSDHASALEVMKLFDLSDLVTDFRFLPTLKSQYDSEFITEDDIDESGETKGPMTSLPAQWYQNARGTAGMEKEIDPYNPDELKRVRVWRISLDPHLFNKLLDKENRKLFTAHSDIMKEHSGLGQTLYNLFTQAIGRSNKRAQGKKENVFFLPLNDLHNLLWPTRKFFRFKEEFIDLMKRYAKEGWDDSLTLNVVSMFGYQFTLMKRGQDQELWVRVERDRNDPLAGDASYFNRRHLPKDGNAETYEESVEAS